MRLYLPIDQVEITHTSVIIDGITHDLESMLPLRIEADPGDAIRVTLHDGPDAASRLAQSIMVATEGTALIKWIEGDILTFHIDDVDTIFGIKTENNTEL